MDHGFDLLRHHDPLLVGFSWIIAIFAAYAALSIIQRLQQGISNRFAWLLGGSVAFGLGVWAMHFTAMTALQIGLVVTFDPTLTATSVVIAIIGAWLAFYLVTQPNISFTTILLSGLLLGAGIGGMHYVGMLAMRMNADLSFDLMYFALSVVVAVAIASIGLWMLSSSILARFRFRNLLIATIVGSAIPLMHYVAMLSSRFNKTMEASQYTDTTVGGLFSLNLFLVLAIVIMSLPAFLTSLVDTPDSQKQESING